MVWNFSVLSIFFVVAILFASEVGVSLLFTTVLWLPLMFFPVVAAQAYSDKESVSLSVFSFYYRKSRAKNNSQKDIGVNVIWPYAMICVISASAANQSALLYYAPMASNRHLGVVANPPKKILDD